MAKGGIGVDKAYCVESGTVMNIFQARDHFFSRRPPRERLNFRCSDLACRTSSAPPTISGVNHHVSLDQGKNYVKPHFRAIGDHIPECEWAETAEAIDRLQQEAIRDPQVPNVCRRFRHAKSGDVIDVYRPASTEEEMDRTEAQDWTSRQVPPGIAGRDARIEYRKTRLRKSPHTTGRLELLVHAYLSLTQDEAKHTFLEVGEVRVSYAAFFWGVRFWRDFAKARVNFGMVGQVEADGDALRIHLWDVVSRPAPQDPERSAGVGEEGDGEGSPKDTFHPARIELDLATLRARRGWRTFATGLDQASRIGCMAYAYGRFEFEDGGYVCRPGSLSNLCLLPYKHVVAMKQPKKEKDEKPGVPG